MKEMELESRVRDMLERRADEVAWEEPQYSQLRRSGLRRRRVRDGVLGASAVALVAGVVFGVQLNGAGNVTSVTSPSSTLSVDSDGWEASQPAMLAILNGDLTVSMRDGYACYRLGGVPVAWPSGYRAQSGTLSVLNDKEQVVAKPGQIVLFGGGTGKAVDSTPCVAAGEWIDLVEGVYPQSSLWPTPNFPSALPS